jgi:hypothetical protein
VHIFLKTASNSKCETCTIHTKNCDIITTAIQYFAEEKSTGKLKYPNGGRSDAAVIAKFQSHYLQNKERS